ncbi:hypothetical protein [Baaleninema simplex]|uniref:hypothetical protein n=1 Tax=Baaleninema simplex TaxID=2862350 RepID=UPI000344B102|nr:hypothetical protein [Baaleninema simplex]
MSPNKFSPHLLILPEDEATKDIANGFHNSLNVNTRSLQILPFAKGTKDVFEKFEHDHISKMRQFRQRRILLLIDFDDEFFVNDPDRSNIQRRLDYIDSRIPSDLKERTFVLGVRDEPETLRSTVKMSFETIGNELARDCPHSQSELWNHEMLRHNDRERERLMRSCGEFLFV